MGRRKSDREAVQEGLSAVLGTGGDLLGDVIRNDRKRGGREVTQETAAPEHERHPTSPSDVMTSGQVVGQADTPADKPQHQRTRPRNDRRARGQERPSVRPSADPDSLLAKRHAEAKRLARTPTMTLTLRVPQGLNDWLDEYVHRAWPERVRKQGLVVEALRMLVARRGAAGEPALPTELLPEEEP